MNFKNLSEFIKVLKDSGELREIDASVNPELEITEIYDRVVKQNGSALLFKNIQGSAFPVAINLYGSYKRMAMALDVKNIDEIAARIKSFLDLKPPQNITQGLSLVPKAFELKNIIPKIVRNAPCQEVVVRAGEGAILDTIPILKCWPKDGGKFITLPIVITKDPQTGVRNLGMYRMQVYDNQTTGMHWHIHKDGSEHFRKLSETGGGKLPVAVAIGADPALMFSAVCPLPSGIDELMLAGFLRRSSVELARCKTIDLEIPSEAEIILEGYVEAGESRLEGPFGDHTGFYSQAKDFPVFHITCMTHRKKPIYATTVVGRPPMEDCFMGKAIERIFLPLIQKQFPEILDIAMPWEGNFHNCLIVKIKKTYPAQGRKIIHALWGLGQMMFSKMIIVLDNDADIQNTSEVAWRVLNNIDPKRDFVFSEGPLDELDHSSPDNLRGSKIGIDATRKTKEEGMNRPWPDDIIMSEEIKKLVTDRWAEYGID